MITEEELRSYLRMYGFTSPSGVRFSYRFFEGKYVECKGYLPYKGSWLFRLHDSEHSWGLSCYISTLYELQSLIYFMRSNKPLRVYP